MNRLLRELRRVNLPTRFRRGGSALGEAGPGGGAGLKVATTATFPARSEVYRTVYLAIETQPTLVPPSRVSETPSVGAAKSFMPY